MAERMRDLSGVTFIKAIIPFMRVSWLAPIWPNHFPKSLSSTITMGIKYQYMHFVEKEMATHSSVLAWRIPGMHYSPLSQILVVLEILLCHHLHTAFLSGTVAWVSLCLSESSVSLCLSESFPLNTGWSHLKIYNLITPVNTLFPNKFATMVSRKTYVWSLGGTTWPTSFGLPHNVFKITVIIPCSTFYNKFSILLPKARCVLELRTFCILEDYMMYPMYYTLSSVGFGASHHYQTH